MTLTAKLCNIYYNVGILRDKTMADKFMKSPILIHKINPSIDYNYWLRSLDTQLNQNSMKVPKVDKPTNKKKMWGLV